jgi:ferrous iron transport protein B
MTRVAFIMDKLLRKIGLSGKSFVPMLLGFGCTVPAIMATRTLSSERDRRMTIFLTPFMSCSAKLPIYAVFTYAFFPNYQALVMIGLYLVGIMIGIISAIVMNKYRFKGKPIPFLMELPNYRFPSLKSTLILLWDKAKSFVIRAFTIIFVASLVIWFFSTFDFRFNPVVDMETSMLAVVSRWLTPLFRPLGFGDWKIVTALIAGFSAKEAVVSILAVLMQTSVGELFSMLSGLFTPLSAVSFLLFTLLYTPCVAAVATMRKELGNRWATMVIILFQTGLAYVVSLLVYQIGRLF